MMSRNPPISSILALSLLVPWCATGDATAQSVRNDSVRRATTGGRVPTRPMRAAGARTRAEGLGVRNAAAPPRADAAADGAVVIAPMTPVQESAAILMRLPPGKRIVHIAGFAGDITAYGDARAAGAVQFSAESDSGLQRGIAQVRDRVLHRMRALRAAGARIDTFSVEHPAALPPGPFGAMVLAEAVDSAVLEVFPRAEAPLRADPGDDAGELVTEGDGDVPEVPSDGVAAAEASPRAQPPTPAQAPVQRAEVPHWETAMQERGIQWERIMDDTQAGVRASARR